MAEDQSQHAVDVINIDKHYQGIHATTLLIADTGQNKQQIAQGISSKNRNTPFTDIDAQNDV